MKDEGLTGAQRGRRPWIAVGAVAVATALGVSGVVTASARWTADAPTVDDTRSAPDSASTAPRPEPATSAVVSTIDAYGPTCDLVADRLRQDDGTLTPQARLEVLRCLADRLEGGPGTPAVDDLANYYGGVFAGYSRGLVIYSEGPLAASAIDRLGPIPTGVTVTQRTDSLSKARMRARVRAGTNAINRSLGDRADDVTIILNAGADGRSVRVDVYDRRACDADPAGTTPSPRDLDAVERAARATLDGLDVVVESAVCLPAA